MSPPLLLPFLLEVSDSVIPSIRYPHRRGPVGHGKNVLMTLKLCNCTGLCRVIYIEQSMRRRALNEVVDAYESIHNDNDQVLSVFC